MPEADLRALYPEDGKSITYQNGRATLTDMQPIGSCNPRVSITMKDGVVKSVAVISRPHGILRETCGDKVRTALSAKYGEPIDNGSDHTNSTLHNAADLVWRRDGVVVHFIRESMDYDSDWSIRYTPVADAGL